MRRRHSVPRSEPISLGHRAVALLRVLVEQRGIPVSKDALMEAAWAGLIVEESIRVDVRTSINRLAADA
jgi:DNA-binding winged helix-turn-helix (wHTH) protein